MTATYAYDGAGNRYAKRVGGTTTTYTLDLASELPQVLAESDGTAYLYGADLIGLERAGAMSYYLPDTLGSTRRVVDGSGAVIAAYTYEAFGTLKTSSGTLANDVRFTGERTDQESGLLFLRARSYDPSTGRFLQPDAWGFDPRDPQDLERYTYVHNDPADAVDPSGRFLDTLFDIVSVAVDVAFVVADPSPENVAFLGADAVAVAVPFVPAGAGWIGRAARAAKAAVKVEELVKDTKTVERVEDAAKLLRDVDKPLLEAPGAAKAAAGHLPEPKPGSTGGPGAGRGFAGSTRERARAESEDTCVFCGRRNDTRGWPISIQHRSCSAAISRRKQYDGQCPEHLPDLQSKEGCSKHRGVPRRASRPEATVSDRPWQQGQN